MEVDFTPDVKAKIEQMAHDTGRRSDEVVATVVAEFFDSVSLVRETLDERYDELKSGRVKPVDGADVFAQLRTKSAARRAQR